MEQRATPLPYCGQVAPQEVEHQEEVAVAQEMVILVPEQQEAASQMTEEGQVVAVDLIIFPIQAPPHQATLVLSDLVYTLLYLPALLSLLEALGLTNISRLFCPPPFCPPHKDILTPEAPVPKLSPITPPPRPPRASLTLLCLVSGLRDPRKK